MRMLTTDRHVPKHVDMASVEDQLAGHAAYFNSILDLIPSKYYVPLEENANKYWRNRRKKAPKQVIKEATKKAKRLRLDPAAQKSVVELQMERDGQRESDDSDTEEGSDLKRPRLRVDSQSSRSVAELRSRLHGKIEEARAKRKAPRDDDPLTQQRKKVKRDEKQKKKKRKLNSKVSGQTAAISQKPMQEIVNDEGRVVFSKFDFTTGVVDSVDEVPSGQKPRKKDFRKLIERAEKQREKMNELRSENPDKAEAKTERVAWKKALEKAEGIKQTDDVVLLKKAAKRREKTKEKGAKEWKKRIGSQQVRQKDKQEKRTRNIRDRVEQKKARKMGIKVKTKKKQRRPGF